MKKCYNLGMKSLSIPLEQQQTMACVSCQTQLQFAIIPNIAPHLYCARCHNVYSEPKAAKRIKSFWWQRFALREQHDLQSHAPVCECGGLFLFNAHPHCTHCGRSLPLPFPEDPKGRLAYSDMIIFDSSKVYLDNGLVETYQFKRSS